MDNEELEALQNQIPTTLIAELESDAVEAFYTEDPADFKSFIKQALGYAEDVVQDLREIMKDIG